MNDVGRVVVVTGLGFEARIAAGPGVRTICGGGDRQRLAAALERELAHGAVAYLSFGMAGGLAANATAGSLLVADAVVAQGSRWPVDAAWAASLARSLPGAVRGRIAGVDAIIASPAEKIALGLATGAYAVDMESHIVAAFATANRMPFAVLRVVADPATQALAPATFVGMRADGTINQRAVAGSLLRTPRQLPLLLRNALAARTAMRALLRGRRLLGPRVGYLDL
jgi:adenosylhomocysteine nucleosidase